VRACQALAADGLRARDAASRLKLHPFAAEKAFGHAANFAPDELAQATIRLAALDHALKGGSRLAPELELERALVEITRPAEPRAAAR
jgi:DNA polymerase III delta subunit